MTPPASLAAARAAKAKAAALLAGEASLNGIGIAPGPDGYRVKVNLSRPLSGRALPTQIDGVPIVVEVVGRITKRT